MAVTLFQGLSEAEAARSLEIAGLNEIASRGGRNVAQIAWETVRQPMFLLLLGAAVLYLLIGDLGEGLFLLAGAAASVGLVIFQEARSERALEALREIAQPHARVVRGGIVRQIPARELAPDDILLVGEGERLPADGVLIGGDVLSVDESLLTGESAPVSRQPVRDPPQTGEAEGDGEGGSVLYAGVMVVRGQGIVQVTRTGRRSAMGKIGESLARIGYEPTPLQQTAARLVGLLSLFALVFCGVIAVAYGVLRDDWLGGVLAGVTVAISLIPEEFPMVLAVFLALGAWRLASHQVLARRSAVIETLGGVTVLCVDKTGTLTENRMQVARLWTAEGDLPAPTDMPPPTAVELLRLAVLASAVRPVDPMDSAIQRLAADWGLHGPASDAEPERTWPLRRDLLAVIQLWRTGEERLAAAKGAPEAIFKLCRLSAAEVAHLQAVIHQYAQVGLRVLGVASARSSGPFAEEPQDVQFHFAGLLGFIDPVRVDVPGALQEARAAGIKVVMITGDHPDTALTIARSAGIDVAAGVLTGAEIASLPREHLRERLQSVRVFARIAPEQKLQIVEALKADGEVVAMTGDGVNDAPALEAAHIGLAMGRKGSDVAREAADLILLDNSFASIVGGIRLGRRIFSNLRRALTYVTAVHVPIAGLALGPILLGLPPLLMPMHIVLLELAIDPTCALVFEVEPSEEGAMKRPPRRTDEPLFGARQIRVALVQGAGILVGVFGLYWWALARHGAAEPSSRGAAFLALVLGILTLALADSAASGKLFAPHRRIYWTIFMALTVVMAAVLWLPALASIFAVSAPSPELLILAITVGVVAGGWSAVFRRAAF